MSKFELSISPEYIPEWTEIDAVRELFQNAIDQEKVNPENFTKWDYDPRGEVLTISNKETSLTTKTLLFGNTTKKDSEELLGSFGEGYKLALLVLTRMGYPVKIFNYAQKEVWIPKIEMSRKYHMNILVIHTQKIRFKKVPNNNLTFVIEQFTPELFEKIKKSNLHIQDKKESIITEQGSILLDPIQKGRIYVGGLLVCEENEFEYGYDIKPKFIKIDRDRKLIRSFDLQWQTSAMWSLSQKPLMIIKLIKQKSPEVNHIDSYGSSYSSSIRDTATADFTAEHGNRAIPVSSQEELEKIMRDYPGLKPIITAPVYVSLLSSYSQTVIDKSKVKIDKSFPPETILKNFLKEHEYNLSKNVKRDFKKILKQSNLWRWK